MVTYIPDQGDVVWLEFDPQKGHEIKKKRPALVVSPRTYNSLTSLALVVPITTKVKGYPFEILIESKKIKGVILADQIRSLDWRARNASKITTVSKSVIDQILVKVSLLIKRQ